MAWGRSTLASSYPAVAMYPILFDYSTSPAGMLPLFFPACKFLQPPVQVQVRFLSRPVTGNYSHDHSGHCEEQDDQYRCFHIMSVPCIRPSIKLMAIALMNMPAMIHKMSIISVPTRQLVWLLHNRWWSWSPLPYVYAQVGRDRYHYDPKVYRTHTST